MSQNILICDDDQMVRSLANKILGRSGFLCCEAANGQEAIDRGANANPAIDLIILDIQLPDLSSEVIIQQMRASNPGLKVLICSGHSPDLQVQKWLKEGTVHYLMKPFGLSSLTQAVQNCLAK